MKPEEQKLCKRLVAQLEQAYKPHQQRCQIYRECDDVYDAILHREDNNRDSELHPPYAWQIIETIIANIVDDQPTSKVVGLTPAAEQKAEKFETLLRYFRNQDDFEAKWEEFVQQGVIRPLTVAKVFWRYEVGWERERSWLPAAEIGGLPQEVATHRERPVCDWPSFLPVDVRHFWWDPAATSMDDARCVYYRTYETRETLEALEERGIYKNVKDLGRNESATTDDDVEDPRAKGRIEVVEVWKRTERGVHLYVIADRKVLLRDEPSPLRHNELPFVVASVSPRPFKFAGRGLAQVMCDLQVALWQTLNQRRDATEIVANPAYEAPADVCDELDRIEPGTLVPSPTPGSIRPINQPIAVISPLIEQENTLLRIMQDLTAANPMAAGTSDPEAVDPKTATEISLVQSAAQRRMQKMKRHMAHAAKRVGRQQIKLIQQLLGAPETIRITGDPASFEVVSPEELQGRFDYEVEDVAEALNQQQRRLEATMMLQTAMNLAAILPQTDPQYRVTLVPTAKKLAQAYGVKPDDLLVELSPQEQMALQLQQQMQQMQVSAPVAGPGADQGAAPPPPPVGGAGAAPNTPLAGAMT